MLMVRIVRPEVPEVGHPGRSPLAGQTSCHNMPRDRRGGTKNRVWLFVRLGVQLLSCFESRLDPAPLLIRISQQALGYSNGCIARPRLGTRSSSATKSLGHTFSRADL